MSNLFRKSIMFVVGFCMYITIEVLFRGYSYPLMGVVGGISLILLDSINNKLSWDCDMLLQCLIGCIIITGFELVVGLAMNAGFVEVMWDYSDIPLNFLGVICLPFCAIWYLLSAVGIIVADAVNYYVFEDGEVPYYKIFRHKVFEFPKKKCDLLK